MLLASRKLTKFLCISFSNILEKCDKIDIGLSVMESRDLVSVSRRVSTPRDPFFEVSVSKVSGLVSVSVSKDFGLGLGLELFDSRLCKVYFL